MVWALVEKLKTKKPKTAQEFVGMPIEYEWKEISIGEKATRDDRIMADGRPAYAWWNEIQMLRSKEPELQTAQMKIVEQMIILKIAEWATAQEFGDPLNDTILVRFKRGMLIMSKDPSLEVMKDPGKFCEVVNPKEKK